MEWVVIAVVLVVVAGVILEASPARRFWADTRPGQPGSADPTGSIPEPDAAFRRPPNEGDLL